MPYNFADLLIINAAQLCVVPSQDAGPQRGHNLGRLGLIEDGALAVEKGKIAAIGPTHDILAVYGAARTIIDAAGKLVTPGLVDPHTHLIWAGDRAGEFERRIQGATYQEIMAEGGGIVRTMRATREADLADLVDEAKKRLDTAMQHGTTTMEVKTGYGLTPRAELGMLYALALLDAEHPVKLVPTFLGAHVVPPEFAGNADGYVDQVVNEMIPAVAAWKGEHWPGDLFCDVFCEDGAFTVEQSRRILEAGRDAGFKLKIHAEQFEALGGTGLAVELGAISADHLDATSDEDIALLGQSDTVAVALPLVSFNLGLTHYPPAQKMLDTGVILALATDCNPGSAWCENMQLAMAVAERYMRLTPGEALAACTINAAHAVGQGDQIGSLEVGRAADIVVWDTNDYRHLGYHFGVNLAETVVIGGEVTWKK